ncbi:MAG: DUF3194 domain-containing protein [Asgard group archaeon]|nr:DUF3194 domain-containing protein [Asgard group archaeon]
MFSKLISLNEKISSNIDTVGLKVLTEEDIQTISEEVHAIIKMKLQKRVPSNKVDNFDIAIDIDNSQGQLQIDIDLISQQRTKHEKSEQEIIDLTLEETFVELEKLLKEKYSC